MRAALLVETDGEFLPAIGGFLKSANREGVDQFVGENDGVSSAGGEGIAHAAMPHGAICEQLSLAIGEGDRGFHQM